MQHLLMKSDKRLKGGTADETGRDLRQVSWLKRSDGFYLELEEKSLRATVWCYCFMCMFGFVGANES